MNLDCDEAIWREYRVASAAGAAQCTMSLDFPGIEVGADLVVELTPIQGEPILCGVELAAEKL